ncbi:MAG: ParB/RepB/Spo0J family partition protein [Meiothermus sp.]|nr:ParB/RepB/Spo0J family partition protein [Meiothermus sp.]
MKHSPIDHFLGKLVAETAAPGPQNTLPLSALSPTPQPRRRFEKLEELAASIKERGVLQPLLVRKAEGGRYEIVAGERRYRAAELAGLTEVPVVVLEVDAATASQIALVENLQREDLNPYEETLGILALLEMKLNRGREEVISLLQRMWNETRGKVTQNVLGNAEAVQVEENFRTLGRMTWQSFVQSRLPLLSLPEDVRLALEEGALPYTAALELKKVKDARERGKLLKLAKEGLSLRELKAQVQALLKRAVPPPAWPRAVASKLSRLRLEALPEPKRKEAEKLLRALEALLEE